jgi:hypothetical protein
MRKLSVPAGSEQAVGRMWVNRVQTRSLSAATSANRFVLWENLAISPRFIRVFSAALHTAVRHEITLFAATFYPHSTGPIKNLGEFK